MMSEIKQIMILSLNFFVVASLPLDCKEVGESLVGALDMFYITQNKNEEDMRLELERGLELLFQKH
jgi:hypothetical protein